MPEVIFFNQKYADNPGDPTPTENAETVKSSRDEVLELPGWLKKMLQILNEPLLLIRNAQERSRF